MFQAPVNNVSWQVGIVHRAGPATSGDPCIVEGEMDALSLVEAGLLNVLSVPDDAPAEIRLTIMVFMSDRPA